MSGVNPLQMYALRQMFRHLPVVRRDGISSASVRIYGRNRRDRAAAAVGIAVQVSVVLCVRGSLSARRGTGEAGGSAAAAGRAAERRQSPDRRRYPRAGSTTTSRSSCWSARCGNMPSKKGAASHAKNRSICLPLRHQHRRNRRRESRSGRDPATNRGWCSPPIIHICAPRRGRISSSRRSPSRS